MKTAVLFVRKALLVTVVISGMNLFASCDSCSRNGNNTEGTQTGQEANGDNSATKKPGDNEDSGSMQGSSEDKNQ